MKRGSDMDAVEFGKELRKIRKDKRLTLTELGEKIDLTQSYLSYIENGKKGMPKPDIIKKIARGLDVSYIFLMELAGYKDHVFYIDDIDDIELTDTKRIEVQIPYKYQFKDSDGGYVTKGIRGDEELAEWLFDLHYLLNAKVKLYYNGELLSDNEKDKIKTMLKTILE